MNINNNFTKTFNELLRKKQYEILDISKKLGVSYAAVHKYSTGESLPSVKHLVMLASFFNVTIDYLLMGKKDNLTITLTKVEDECYEISGYIKLLRNKEE